MTNTKSVRRPSNTELVTLDAIYEAIGEVRGSDRFGTAPELLAHLDAALLLGLRAVFPVGDYAEGVVEFLAENPYANVIDAVDGVIGA